jgi:hypothetical protein
MLKTREGHAICNDRARVPVALSTIAREDGTPPTRRPADRAADIATLLRRDLRAARQRLPLLVERGGVTIANTSACRCTPELRSLEALLDALGFRLSVELKATG